eukprot:scaffold228470_cov35-Tisochrysis_lutea.AAC.1
MAPAANKCVSAPAKCQSIPVWQHAKKSCEMQLRQSRTSKAHKPMSAEACLPTVCPMLAGCMDVRLCGKVPTH